MFERNIILNISLIEIEMVYFKRVKWDREESSRRMSVHQNSEEKTMALYRHGRCFLFKLHATEATLAADSPLPFLILNAINVPAHPYLHL